MADTCGRQRNPARTSRKHEDTCPDAPRTHDVARWQANALRTCVDTIREADAVAGLQTIKGIFPVTVKGQVSTLSALRAANLIFQLFTGALSVTFYRPFTN
jgi:hypothetical protein